MATFSGLSGSDTITPQMVSSQVMAVPAESRPSAARDVILGFDGGDYLEGGGGNDEIYGGPNASVPPRWIDSWVQWRVEDGGNGNCYALVKGGRNWTNAQDLAERFYSGHLATITSEAENAFVAGVAEGFRSWLGGFQAENSAEPGGGWQWVTGEPFRYTNWAPGQPDQATWVAGEQDWLLAEDGQWDDYWGNSVFFHLLEYPVTDILHGNSGDDLIYGGRSNDDRADGPDRIYGDAGNDTVWAGGGDDVVYGGSGQDKLYGQSDNDRIYGGGDRDWLGGGTGNDYLYGQGGPDILSGREGSDRLSGGGGNDRYDYDDLADSGPGAANRDVILNFGGVGEARGDRIDLSAIDAITSKGGNQAFDFIGTDDFNAAGQVRVVASGGYTLVQANTDGTFDAAELEIQVKDGAATPGQWVASDFVL